MAIFENEKKNKTYLLILSMLSFFSNLWVRGADLMEARNLVAAREMVVRGNWIVPTLNGNLRFEKPPLPTWLTAFVMKVTGNTYSEWIARIPVALVFVLFVFLIYYLVKTLTKNEKLSFICSLVSSTMFMLMKMGKENSWDVYPYVFAVGVIVFFLRGMEKAKLKEYLFGGVFLCMSLMSKGPVAIWGLLIPFFAAHMLTYGVSVYKRDWKKMAVAVFLGIFLSALWPVAVMMQHKDYFVQVMKKEQNTWGNSHTNGFFYYLDYFVYTGIWMFFCVAVLFKKWMDKRVACKKSFKFIYLWNALVILCLSVIAMKKKRYGIPIYMTSSIMVGYLAHYYVEKGRWSVLEKSDRLLIKLQGVLLGIICIGAPVLLFVKGYLAKRIGATVPLVVLILFTAAGIWLWKSWKNKEDYGVRNIVVGSGIVILLANISCNWFIEREIRRKGPKEYPVLSDFKKDINHLKIYAENYNIIDVWNSGKEINSLENLKEDIEEFWVMDSDGIFDQNLGEYTVAKEKKFYRNDSGRDTVNMYLLKK